MSSQRKYNKIFGIGLSKTGTTSLGMALKQMGISTIDFPHDPVTLKQLESGDFQLRILDSYDAVTDTPVVPYYPQLDKLYPGSKFILTVRNVDSWLESIHNHWADRGPWLEIDENQRRFAYFINTAVYGSIAFNKDRFRYVYERHVQEVGRYFAARPDDLITIDICSGQTTGRLGEFLGIATSDDQFPRANTKADRSRNAQWIEYLRQMHVTLDRLLPLDARVLWVDECQLLGLKPRNVRKAKTFPEQEGVYLGLPENDDQACEYIEESRSDGGEFLVFIHETMWWLDHYAGLSSYLRSQYQCIFDEPHLKVFDIRTSMTARATRT